MLVIWDEHEMKRKFEVMPVASDEVVRILGSLNMEDVENGAASIPREINNSQLARSIKLYFDFDHRDVTSGSKQE